MIETYIIRYSKPLPNPNRWYGDEWHYVGKSDCVGRRECEHIQGRGSSATRLALALGATLTLVYVHAGDLECTITSRIQEFCPCDLCRTYRLAQPLADDYDAIPDKYGD